MDRITSLSLSVPYFIILFPYDPFKIEFQEFLPWHGGGGWGQEWDYSTQHFSGC